MLLASLILIVLCSVRALDPWRARQQEGTIGEEALGRHLRKQGMLLGIDPSPSLRSLSRLARRAARHDAAARLLWRVYGFRLVLAAGFAVCIRIALGHDAAVNPGPDRWVDAIAQAWAALLAITMLACLRRGLKPGWFWSRGPTPAACDWLLTFAFCLPLSGSKYSGALRALNRQSALSGQDPTSAVRGSLRACADEEFFSDYSSLRKITDCLALFELLGIGLPAVLIMLMPALAALG